MAEGTLTIKFLGDPSKLKSDFDTLGSSAGTFEGKISGASSKFGNFASVASGIVAAGALSKVAGFLKDGATGAMEDAAAMDRLKQAVTNTGTSFDSYSTQIDDAIKKGQDLAFSDGEVMSALTALTNATGSTEEGLSRLSLAQDLARGTGMSLEQASKLLGKTSDENTATLARYGIQLGENATAQDVMNEVDKRFGGQAAAFAESDAGKWAALQLQLGEVQETIGAALIPAIGALVAVVGTIVTALEPVLAFLGENIIPTLIILGTVVTGALIPALIAWATTMWTVTIPALVATMVPLLPFIAVAAAIGLAIAALYLAWDTNFLGIRDITIQVFGELQALFETVWPYISAIVDVAMQAISLYVTTYLGIVQTVVSTVLGAVQGIFNTFWPVISAVVDVAMQLISGYVSTYMALIQLAIQTVLDAINLLWGPFWDGLKATVDTVMGVGGGIVGSVTSGIQAVYDAVVSKLDALKGYWDGAWNAMKGTVDAVIGAVTSAWNFVAGVINAGLGAAESVINGMIDVYNKVAGPLPGVDPIGHISISGALPIIGGGGGTGGGIGIGPQPYGPTSPPPPPINQVPSNDPGWSTGGGQKPGDPGFTTGGGQKPVPGDGTTGGTTTGPTLPGGQTGNLSGGSSLATVSSTDMHSMAKLIGDAVRQAMREALTGAI